MSINTVLSHRRPPALLAPGAYPDRIEPGAFVEPPVQAGDPRERHAVITLMLAFVPEIDLPVRVEFGIDNRTARCVSPRDAAVLAKWADIVEVPTADDWHDLTHNLWRSGQRLPQGTVLAFTICPLAADRHALNDVEVRR